MLTAILHAIARPKAGPTGRDAFPPSWYDRVYRESRAYAADPEVASWRPIWDAAIAMIPERAMVVDLGCGPGQFAELLLRRRIDIRSYDGVDFSGEAIRMAEKRIGGRYRWARFQALDLDHVAVQRGQVAVCLEVMEHLADDALPIRRCEPGTLFIGSVPGYDSASHVRVYDESMIEARFGPHLSGLCILEVPVAGWKRAFVFRGTVLPS